MSYLPYQITKTSTAGLNAVHEKYESMEQAKAELDNLEASYVGDGMEVDRSGDGLSMVCKSAETQLRVKYQVVMDGGLASKGVQFYTPAVLCFDLIARHLRPKKPHILIACMPKSGSTFLANTLASYGGFKRKKLLPTYGLREQELCELRLCMYGGMSYVAQQHIRNSEWTQELIRRYGLSTVVLVRDILDCVVSVRDHIRLEGNLGSVLQLPEGYRNLSDTQLDDLIVQFAMPWYLNFYASWRNAPGTLFMNYDDVTANPAVAVGQILDFAGVKKSEAQIEEALASVQNKRTRFNKGVSGRGRAVHDEAKLRLRSMVSFYPEFARDRIFNNLWEEYSLTK